MEADTDMDMEDVGHMEEDIIAARIAGGMGVVGMEGTQGMVMEGTHITGR